jgi:succinate-semialdehyde dehydrogenase/glutarate-semialdehyde dehydrogenase
MEYRTLNPTTEEQVETFPLSTEANVETSLATAADRFNAWRRNGIQRRAALLFEVAEALESQADALSRLMALEMGKPLAQGVAEAKKCAWGARYYAENAEALLRPDPRDSDGREAMVRYDPLGPILAVMPWNFPFWQFFRFAAPALIAGNVVLLKHAPNTPRCALAIEQLVREAGGPVGVVQNLFLTNEQAARIITDDRVRGVTLTGSTRAGREVASVGGRQLKAMVMELGGSDPFVVFDDADLDQAVRVGVEARCQNNGQSCIAAKRFLVHRSRFADFREAFVAGMAAKRLGDPTDSAVEIGPLARRDLRERLARQVEESVAAGAEVLCGGAPPSGKGFFYPPTVLTAVADGTPAAEDELFGPVAALFPFDDDAEALALANATRYGLGASLWTRDLDRARSLIPEIEAGSVFVNSLVKSDPRLPFGGVKQSGFGRELSREGLLQFVNQKTVWVG